MVELQYIVAVINVAAFFLDHSRPSYRLYRRHWQVQRKLHRAGA